MNLTKLSELLDISIGRTPSRNEPDYWGKGHPWVSIRDLSLKTVVETKEQITDLGVSGARCKLIPKGTLLFSFKLTIGKMAFAGCDLYTNEAIAAFLIKDKKKLNPDFLYYALQAATYGGSNQAVMGKTLNSKSLANIEIPVPPLDDQISIARLLGKVEALIAQRKQHLQQLDDLLKSVFLEMFGDPIINPHKFPIRRLSEFYVNPKEGTKCGPFGSALKKDELVDAGVPVWNMDNIAADGQMVLPFRMWITNQKYDELLAYSVRDGDIIISRAGTVGKMCVARMNGQPAIISTNLIRVRLGSELRPLHFVSLMLYCKGRVGRLKTGADGSFTHMNTGVLDSLEFPYPPIELQNKYGEIADKIEGIKSRYKHILTDLEALYSALSQLAFKGELDLAGIFPPTASEYIPNEINSERSPHPSLAAISLPETDLLHAALNDREKLKLLLDFWLQAYIEQLGERMFTVNEFIRVAESHVEEALPDRDFELDVDAYNLIKTWVFDELHAGNLEQIYPSQDIRVALRKPRNFAESQAR